MNIRQQIIERLDNPCEDFRRYLQLKNCLVCKPSSETYPEDAIDNWFKCVIHSLYYRPNHYCLVLVGNQNMGKTQFFRRLFPDQHVNGEFYTEFYPEGLYSNLVIGFDEGMEKKHLNLPMEDNFIITHEETEYVYARCDKRLASYCCTTNVWRHPQRKNYIVLHLESINQELYNSIDKELLWIEIFNKFKPEL